MPTLPIPDKTPSLDDLMITKPGSSIELDRPAVVEKIEIDLQKYGRIFWGEVSNELLNSYNFGVNCGKFGDNKKDIEKIFIRLSNMITESIKNEFSIESQSSENLILHLKILSSIMRILGKEIKDKKLDHDVELSLIATLHGFIEQYTNQLIIQ